MGIFFTIKTLFLLTWELIITTACIWSDCCTVLNTQIFGIVITVGPTRMVHDRLFNLDLHCLHSMNSLYYVP